MGCGSGKAIAEIISGRRPDVDFAFSGMPRRNSGLALSSRPIEV
jgi:D-amino-acid dehydrogenase